MDAQTKEALRRIALAVDGLAGMVAGCAAYMATLDNAAFADRNKAVGLAQKLAPEGLSGDDAVTPARAAQAMIEQIATLSREMQALKNRLDRPNIQAVQRDWDMKPRTLKLKTPG